MRSGPYVEVQKTPGSSTWYNAIVLDIVGDSIHVEFEDDVWPAKEYPMSSVRRCPSPHADESFSPKVDDPLEVWVPATETNPSGWALGRLKQVKNKSFFFVALEGPSKGPQDIIAEREGIRKASTEPAIDASTLVRKLIPVDRELHGWIRSQDSMGCLNDVLIKGKLLIANCTHDRPDAKGAPKVSLVGDDRAVALGERLLVDIHFKHQITMQRFHVHRDKLMEHLSQRESRYNAEHKEVFTIDSSFVGRIIGKKGENIKRIKDEYEVNVVITDPQDPKKNITTIAVSGASLDAVKKAREEMEFIIVKIPIDPEQVGWIVGKGYQNLTEISKNAELSYARFDDHTGSIELCGLRHQVEDAKMMISVHRDYLLVYRDMSEEKNSIKKRFEELDELDGKAGKRGGKAKAGKGVARGRASTGGGKASRGSRGAQDYDGYGEDSAWGPGSSSSGRPATGRGRKGRGK